MGGSAQVGWANGWVDGCMFEKLKMGECVSRQASERASEWANETGMQLHPDCEL